MSSSHLVYSKQKAKPDIGLSDEELVLSLQQVLDADRFGLLYDRYAARVYQKCIGMVRDQDIAKDLTHDIFLKVFVNLKKFDHRSKFGTWLYSITYNYCLDHLRKGQRQRTTQVDEGMDLHQDEEDRYEVELLSMRSDQLPAVLEALDPGDRAVLLMKYQDELSIKEMMEILELGESAVKMRVMRSRERALAKYQELYPEGS